MCLSVSVSVVPSTYELLRGKSNQFVVLTIKQNSSLDATGSQSAAAAADAFSQGATATTATATAAAGEQIAAGSIRVSVRTLSVAQERSLRYDHWELTCRSRVEERAPEIGYVHLVRGFLCCCLLIVVSFPGFVCVTIFNSVLCYVACNGT